MDIDKIMEDMMYIIKDCKEIFLEGFHNAEKKIDTKTNENDLVTEYDVKINDKILEFLKDKYPDFNFVTEEAEAIQNDHEYTFYVDPIDGTRNFSRGIPICHIGIGLEKNNELVACATYNPVQDKFYHAIKGKGAFVNEQRMHVSNRPLSQADLYFNSLKEKKAEAFKFFIEKAPLIKFEWCAHNSFSLVACGKCEGMVTSYEKPWDMCHYLLVEEAGGKVTTHDGKPYNLSEKSLIISNGVIHDELIKGLKELY